MQHQREVGPVRLGLEAAPAGELAADQDRPGAVAVLTPLTVLGRDPVCGRGGGEGVASGQRQVAGVARLVEQCGHGVEVDLGEADECDLGTGHVSIVEGGSAAE
jgi:hypothetical protein